MERVCFTMRVAPEHIDTYIAMHANTWPELLEGLHRTGWENYSLFLRADGYLIGYLESADWSRSSGRMAGLPVSALWSAEMDRLVVPGTRMQHLTLVDSRGSRSGTARRIAALVPDEVPTAAWASFALFRAEDGTRVLYGELDADDLRLPFDEFVEVFNLDRQLERISS